MGKNSEIAVAKYDSQYNCAQSVVCTYTDKIGMDEQIVYKLSEGLGAGMGTKQELCGAAAAMGVVAGATISKGSPANGVTKLDTYAVAKQMADKFESKMGSLRCGVLLENGKQICKVCIAEACNIIDETLFSE